MRIAWLQSLMVCGLVAVFAALLPTHHHAPDADANYTHAHADHAHQPAGPASDGDSQPADSHPQHECPICRATGSLTLDSPLIARLLIAPTPQFVHAIDQPRPASQRVPLPFHGRAPPAC